MKKNFNVYSIFGIIIFSFLLIGLFSFLKPIKVADFIVKNDLLPESGIQVSENNKSAVLETKPKLANIKPLFPFDIDVQQQLENPSKVIKAIYLTGWSAGQESKISEVISFAQTGKINAVVIDIKDFSGKISYDTDVKEAEDYFAEEARIPRINSLIRRFHDEGIYVIARQAVFQDQVLTAAKPELAIKSIKLSLPAQAGLPAGEAGEDKEDYRGFMLWNPANVYTKEAL